jgi:hypothetical protein
MLDADLFTERAPPIVTQALGNSERWKIEALGEFEKLWRECRHNENQFTFEMLRFSIVKAIGQPPRPECWGALAAKAVKRGWIQCVGVANAVSTQANHSLRRKYVWRSQ